MCGIKRFLYNFYLTANFFVYKKIVKRVCAKLAKSQHDNINQAMPDPINDEDIDVLQSDDLGDNSDDDQQLPLIIKIYVTLGTS